MEILMFLALPLMLLGGFALYAATNDDDATGSTDPEETDDEPII